MKKIKLFSFILIVISILICFSGCKPKGVNILEQPKDYVGEFYVPSSRKVEKGTPLSIVTKINEDAFKIKSAFKTKSDDPTVLESYRIDCYGVTIELFHYTDDAQRLKEAREQEKFIIRSEDGKVVREFYAVANQNFVIMFNTSKDATGNDCTEQNKKVAELFKSLTF